MYTDINYFVCIVFSIKRIYGMETFLRKLFDQAIPEFFFMETSDWTRQN
jgi:hypothetical protein